MDTCLPAVPTGRTTAALWYLTRAVAKPPYSGPMWHDLRGPPHGMYPSVRLCEFLISFEKAKIIRSHPREGNFAFQAG